MENYYYMVPYGILVLSISVMFAYFIVSGRMLGRNYKVLGIPSKEEGVNGESTQNNDRYFNELVSQMRSCTHYSDADVDGELIKFVKAVKYLGRDIAILDEQGNVIGRW